jgi:hypothetical protein
LELKILKVVFYKDTLTKIEPNSSYIFILNSQFDEDRDRNKGSHWTALVIDENI